VRLARATLGLILLVLGLVLVCTRERAAARHLARGHRPEPAGYLVMGVLLGLGGLLNLIVALV
jgi:hypothetical protein